MTVWICGNSHVGALQSGRKVVEGAAPLFTVFPFGTGKGERVDFSGVKDNRVCLTWEPYAENLQRFTGKSHLDPEDVWGICLGTHAARIYRKKQWAKTEPSEIAGPQARPVSAGLLEAIIEENQSGVRSFIDRLLEANIRCFMVACPPPRQDHICFNYGTRRETVGFIYRRAYSALAAWLSERSVDLIAPPPQSMTEDGFLKSEFNVIRPAGTKPDRHHANEEYGALMVQRIIDYIRSKNYG